MEVVKRIVVGAAIAGIAVLWIREVFVEGQYLTAAMWNLPLLWLGYPKGHRAYSERRAQGIPAGQTGFYVFTKLVFSAMLVLTVVLFYRQLG